MAETAPITLVFATHPRVPAATGQKLLALILSWPDTEEGRAMLAAGAWPGFVAAQDADYAQVRARHPRMLAEREPARSRHVAQVPHRRHDLRARGRGHRCRAVDHARPFDAKAREQIASTEG